MVVLVYMKYKEVHIYIPQRNLKPLTLVSFTPRAEPKSLDTNLKLGFASESVKKKGISKLLAVK